MDMGRHGWLRLTPAYSVKLVEEILQHVSRQLIVLDPFSGTGTTPLCSIYYGHSAVGYELNPFLVWLSSVKIQKYPAKIIESTKEILADVVQQLRSKTYDTVNPPPIHNINRWWSKERLDFLCRLMWTIQKTCPRSSPNKDLLLVAFCRVMIDLSNASFSHQSMSFKNTLHNKHPELFSLEPDYISRFELEASKIISSAQLNPCGNAEIFMGDSRKLVGIDGRKFDLLITSPPYPNRMSYIRELRPYMYWLNYLNEAREAGELDWQAIGGTWGIATSRLNEWEPTPDVFSPEYLHQIIDEIAKGDGKNGELLSRYVAKYFEDVWLHLFKVYSLIREGGRVHYIVGNSVFYGTIVPVEKIYRDMLREIGFRETKIDIIRKRNSKKALFEFNVSAKK
jgi:DNA modification methylase